MLYSFQNCIMQVLDKFSQLLKYKKKLAVYTFQIHNLTYFLHDLLII